MNRQKLQRKPLLSQNALRINYEISMGRASIRQEQGRIKEALSFFVQASKFNDKDTPLLSLISHLAIKLKDFQLASVMYIKWVDLDPHNPETWYFLQCIWKKIIMAIETKNRLKNIWKQYRC